MTRRFRPTLWATLFVIPALALLIGLGFWQLERREWKHALVARIEASAASEPMDLVGALTASGIELDYAHVEVDGDIAPSSAIHLFAPVGQGAVDYRVIAPLDYGNGRKILVDLGSITEAEKTTLGPAGIPKEATGLRHIEGVLRPSQEPGWFDAAPDLKANRWYVRDVPAIAAALGVNAPWPFILQSDQENPGGLPRPVPFHPDLPDNHLSYAITWFSLAFALLVIFVLKSLRSGRSATYSPPSSS